MDIHVYRQKRLSEDEVCHETNTTVVKVLRCPENEAILNERSKKKMCKKYPKCHGEPLVYHCVRSKDNFVEVCAPRRQIVGSCCAVFDVGIGLVIEDYKRPCNECPFKYQSDGCLKYSTCLSNFSQLIDREFRTTTPSDDAGCTQNSNKCTGTSRQNELMIVLTAAALAVTLISCFALIFRNRHHCKDLNKKRKENDSAKWASSEKEKNTETKNEPFLVNGNCNYEPT